MAKTKRRKKGGIVSGQGPVVIGDDGSLLGGSRKRNASPASHLTIQDQNASGDRLSSLDQGAPVTLLGSTIRNLTATDGSGSGLTISDTAGVTRIDVSDNTQYGFIVTTTTAGLVIISTEATSHVNASGAPHVSPHSGPVASMTIHYGANVSTLPGRWTVTFNT